MMTSQPHAIPPTDGVPVETTSDGCDGYVVWDRELRRPFRSLVYCDEAAARNALANMVWHNRQRHEVRPICVLAVRTPSSQTTAEEEHNA